MAQAPQHGPIAFLARLWPVFAATRASLAKRGLLTGPEVFAAVATHYAGHNRKPFSHVVVDEAQDLGVAELRFLAAVASPGPDALFFAGDLRQRIFQQPFSWAALGVDVRGRSSTLLVNYRTSHAIRRMADKLLPGAVRDVDGDTDARSRTVSLFDGPAPELRQALDEIGEISLVAEWLRRMRANGIAPSEIGVFVRTRAKLPRARAAAKAAGQDVTELSDRVEASADQVLIGTMHGAKGLEVKAAAVMACDEGVLPSQARLEAAADETEMDEIYETERHLLHVACTRARDHLLVSAVAPGSEFLADL